MTSVNADRGADEPTMMLAPNLFGTKLAILMYTSVCFKILIKYKYRQALFTLVMYANICAFLCVCCACVYDSVRTFGVT